MRTCLFIISTLIFAVSLAQESPADTLAKQRDSVEKQYFFFEGDSLPRTSIELEPVFIFQPLHFDSYNAKRRYYILRRKTLKVYPYAKMAADRLTELNERLNQIEGNAARKRYTKIIQRYIEEEFAAELKKLTRTEGQILVKLIYRQTGITAFDLVKDLRSGWRAFWYNTTAGMFDISLKETYEPGNVHEDYLIEDILQRAFAVNKLEFQPTALGFDYEDLTNKWTSSDLQPK
ncbi:DUF4294 domain-containing protein [Robertkochia sediminum]|uniref:DUF4294 domain-containing protein n=1 Tax=Robertkochia sediminum TaxID=2785326 RepID=UPI003742CF58